MGSKNAFDLVPRNIS